MKPRLIFLLLLGAVQTLWATPVEIILLRHGEKPLRHSDVNLSERGRERALALAPFLTTNNVVIAHGLPVALFAPQSSARGHGRRPEETLEPLARKLKLSIQTPVGPGDYAELARRILNDPALDGKTVVICWVHEFLPNFARALGVKHKPRHWKDDVYDRVWVITYGKHGATLSDVPQHLLPGDSNH